MYVEVGGGHHVRVCRGLGDWVRPLFVTMESGLDCSRHSLNRPWLRVWRFHVYCVRHPVLLAINRLR